MQFSGAKVRAIREKRGMSRHQVAKTMDVRDVLVTRWESDRAVPSGINMVKLLRTLGAELEEVVE